MFGRMNSSKVSTRQISMRHFTTLAKCHPYDQNGSEHPFAFVITPLDVTLNLENEPVYIVAESGLLTMIVHVPRIGRKGRNEI